jgi:hypothetical protein
MAGTAVYQQAVRLTLASIEERARLYVRLVIVAAATVPVSAALAIAFRFWLAIAGAAFLCGAVGCYFLLDSRATSRWRERILGLWQSEGLDLAAFAASALAYPNVPTRTLEGMLAQLPQAGRSISEYQKSVLAERARALAGRYELRVVAASASFALVLLFAAAAAASRSPLPLAGSAVALVLWAASRWR